MIFEKDGVRFKTRFGEARLETIGLFCMEIPEAGIKIYGENRDLAKIANDLRKGRIDESALKVLKYISDHLSGEDEKELVAEFAGASFNPDELAREVNLIEKQLRQYEAYHERGYEYFPSANQLLLSTGNLITFNASGGAEVAYVDVRDYKKFVRYISAGRVKYDPNENFWVTICSTDIEDLKKAAPFLPSQHGKVVEVLELIGNFSSKKQSQLLNQLRTGSLPSRTLRRLKQDMASKERAAELKEEYEEAYEEFWDNAPKIGETRFWLNKLTNELLIRPKYHDYLLVSFKLPVQLRLDSEKDAVNREAELRDVNIGYELDDAQVIGRWIKRGKWSTSRYFHLDSVDPQTLADPGLELLGRISRRIPEPYRSPLRNLLVASKMSRYAKSS